MRVSECKKTLLSEDAVSHSTFFGIFGSGVSQNNTQRATLTHNKRSIFLPFWGVCNWLQGRNIKRDFGQFGVSGERG